MRFCTAFTCICVRPSPCGPPGGVLSGIGKGVTASSIGVLCKMMGLKPTAIKIDPYLNVDAGTMSPFEHGEVCCRCSGFSLALMLARPVSSCWWYCRWRAVDIGVVDTADIFMLPKVFVLDDGGETDLDLGNYERFMGVNLRNESNLTTGYVRHARACHTIM